MKCEHEMVKQSRAQGKAETGSSSNMNSCVRAKRTLSVKIEKIQQLTLIIIQHTDTLAEYGKKKLLMYVSPRNVYPTIYASYTCKVFNFFKKNQKACRWYFLFKPCFIINMLNYKTIIALKLAWYRLILADSAIGLAHRLSIRRCHANFRAIMFKYLIKSMCIYIQILPSSTYPTRKHISQYLALYSAADFLPSFMNTLFL